MIFFLIFEIQAPHVIMLPNTHTGLINNSSKNLFIETHNDTYLDKCRFAFTSVRR